MSEGVHSKSNKQKAVVGRLAIPIAMCATLLAAVLGSLASVQAGAFYLSLDRPSWAPGPSVFGPVWTVLYAMIGLAGGMALKAANPRLRLPATLFVIQLGLNALWSWTFFAWRSGTGSTVTIVALWVSIIATTIVFWRIKPAAGLIMLPYLAWVTFAAALNIAIWQMNESRLS